MSAYRTDRDRVQCPRATTSEVGRTVFSIDAEPISPGSGTGGRQASVSGHESMRPGPRASAP